jgi:predicted transcriptional regulator
LYAKDDQPTTIDRSFHTLTVRVPPALHSTIDEIARADGETVAAVVRMMLRRGVELRQAART